MRQDVLDELLESVYAEGTEEFLDFAVTIRYREK